MKKKILVIILAALFLLSCKKQDQEYSGLNEFEVLDVDVEGLSEKDAMDKAYAIVDERYPVTSIDFKEEDRIVDQVDLRKAGIKLLADFRATGDEIVVLDQEDNNIKVIDWEGNLLKSIGKLGSGDMEFKTPTSFFFDQANKLYYILDNGNKRIVVIDEDFNFVKNINVETLKEKEDYYNPFNSIALYKDKIYLSETFGREKTMAIISIDMDGNEKLYDQKFGGILKVVDDKLYSIEQIRGFKFGKKVDTELGSHEYQIWPSCADAMYLVEEDKMKKLYDLPNLASFTDMLKIGDSYYLPSGSFGILHEFKVVNKEMKYQKSLTHQLLDNLKDHVDSTRRFKMQEMDGNILLMDAMADKIYIIDLSD